MNEDLVVRTTVDFIRSSPKYLDLALQIEEAMPRLKAGLIEEFLKSVESTITTDEWRLHRWDAGLTKKNCRLALRRADWPSDEDPADPTGILLGTDEVLWGRVYVGIYLSKMTQQRIRAKEQQILPSLERAWEKLPPQGKGWQTKKSDRDLFGDWHSAMTYRYLNEPVGDWGSAQFLRNSLDDKRREEMVKLVTSQMEFLKCAATGLVEATLRTA